jgi:hypothetical protein
MDTAINPSPNTLNIPFFLYSERRKMDTAINPSSNTLNIPFFLYSERRKMEYPGELNRVYSEKSKARLIYSEIFGQLI